MAVTGGVYTTAGGSDTNSGLDPAHPKASISAILNSYVLQPGNVIMVDQSTYNLSTNLTVGSRRERDSPLKAWQRRRPSSPAWQRTNGGDFDFDFQRIPSVTAGKSRPAYHRSGSMCINASYGNISNGLTVTNCNFYGDENIGIYLEGNNGSATITNSAFHDMLGTSTYGVENYSYANTITLTGNTAYNMAYGFYFTNANTVTANSVIGNNMAYDNSVGIYASNGANMLLTVSDNVAYDNYQYNFELGGTGMTATGNTCLLKDGAVAAPAKAAAKSVSSSPAASPPTISAMAMSSACRSPTANSATPSPAAIPSTTTPAPASASTTVTPSPTISSTPTAAGASPAALALVRSAPFPIIFSIPTPPADSASMVLTKIRSPATLSTRSPAML